MKLQEDLMFMAYCSFQGEIEEIIYHKHPAKISLEIGGGIFKELALDQDKVIKLKGLFHKKEQFFNFLIHTSFEREEKQRVLHGFPQIQGYLILIEEAIHCGEGCQNAYEEIMKLNSKLANAQREVAKKNAELQRMNKKLETLAKKDSLTGLLNRYALEEKFRETLKRCKRMEKKFSLAMVDFNDFKKVNDALGHSAGDQLLRDFAALALEETRTGFDYVFRMGGDEFLFLFEDCREEEAKAIILRIEKKLKKYSRIASLAYGAMEISIDRDVELEKILKQVDVKMYENKRKKPREVHFIED